MRFAMKAFGVRSDEPLDRNAAVETRIDRAIDFPSPTSSDEADELIRTEQVRLVSEAWHGRKLQAWRRQKYIARVLSMKSSCMRARLLQSTRWRRWMNLRKAVATRHQCRCPQQFKDLEWRLV